MTSRNAPAPSSAELRVVAQHVADPIFGTDADEEERWQRLWGIDLLGMCRQFIAGDRAIFFRFRRATWDALIGLARLMLRRALAAIFRSLHTVASLAVAIDPPPTFARPADDDPPPGRIAAASPLAPHAPPALATARP
jgi:hypothetical protein